MCGKAGHIVAPYALVAADNILHGSAGEEILLLEAKTLALIGAVVGIQHAGDILYLVLLANSQIVLLIVEQVKVELLNRFALPQAQGTDIVGAVADYGHIVGYCKYLFVRKGDLDGLVVAAAAPGIAVALPIVSLFYLIAILKALLEQTEFIAQAIALQRQVMGGGAVKEAGSQTAKAAVAQSCVLDIFENVYIRAPCPQQFLYLIQQAQAVKVVEHHATHKVFGGQIICPAYMLMGAPCSAPVIGYGIHNGVGQRLMQLISIRFGNLNLIIAPEFLLHAADYHAGFHHSNISPHLI